MKGLLALVACLVLTAHPSQVGEIERPNGLMWNKTGLPLVFPLHIKSTPGRDYYVILKTVEEDAAVLAAYVRGGDFFRVLVPPGQYKVEFATGSVWRGEKMLFGAEGTQKFVLADPLEFAILDESTKGGHSLDMRNLGSDGIPEVIVTSANICQTAQPHSFAGVTSPDPQGVEREPVGQSILKRRFERGENAYDLYDRQRQQDNFDPPVLGAPRVPLGRPVAASDPSLNGRVPVRTATRIYERPC